MTEIPLYLRLKKESHKNIAIAQDIILEEIYKIFSKAVLHGGTAIWRCYKGNRFSEDLDLYIIRDIIKINIIFSNLEKRGFIILKKKISENSLYSTLKFDRTIVRFEALFKKVNGKLVEYEKINGNLIIIYSLSSEELLKEKIETYLKRKKIRDLYDIFFLLKSSNKKEIKNNLLKFVKNFEKPVDEKNLKVLILDGIAPNYKKMFEYIKNSIK